MKEFFSLSIPEKIIEAGRYKISVSDRTNYRIQSDTQYFLKLHKLIFRLRAVAQKSKHRVHDSY